MFFHLHDVIYLHLVIFTANFVCKYNTLISVQQTIFAKNDRAHEVRPVTKLVTTMQLHCLLFNGYRWQRYN